VNADTGTIIGLDDLTESMGSSDDDLMDGESSDMSYGDDGASTDDGGGDTGTIEWMSTFARHNGFGRDRTGGGETAGMIRVWYGTNRKPTGNSAEYRWERHSRDDGNPIITYGHLDVNIPRSHRLGEIGNPLWRRLLRGELKSDRLEITDRAMLEEDRFWSSLRTSVSDLKEMADGDDVHAMVYIHGYNVTFDQAAIRAAQLGYDLKVPGPTAFFSWPSRGRTDSYLSDVASIEASVMAIKTFLSEFSIKSGADRIHLIIHSMGNRGVLRALSQLTSQLENEVQKPFRQIILAAPDVDSNEFQQLAAMLTRLCSRSTMYASRRDWAVWLSRIIHRHTRAGYFLPYTVAQGVDTIAVPSFNADLLGHSYYAEAHELLHDIFMLIHSDFAPQNRQRVFPLSIDGMRLWRLVR
jgi:esterase/lipase superfamily enzyme